MLSTLFYSYTQRIKRKSFSSSEENSIEEKSVEIMRLSPKPSESNNFDRSEMDNTYDMKEETKDCEIFS